MRHPKLLERIEDYKKAFDIVAVLADTLGARGAECLRNSTGVEAQEGGVFLAVICVKFGEQIWRREEEK